MSFKRTFYLVQHTPQLHFEKQNRDTATLRATEVKPKLDKYLLGMLGEAIQEDWLRTTKQGDISFDYEMRIVLAEGTKLINGIIQTDYEAGEKGSNNLVLANMGKEKPEDKKYFILYQNTIEKSPSHHLQVFSYYPEILAAIENHMAGFLLTHNFGNRQTKGFGSYYLHPESTGYAVPRSKWSFTVNAQSSPADMKTVFDKISLLWKALRPGINDGIYDKLLGRYSKNTFYFKSLIFMYAKHLGIQWDKKTIKENFFANELPKQPYSLDGIAEADSPVRYSSTQKKLMKDLLGLSLSEGWGKTYSEAEITKNHTGSEGKVIERFASPILFKPIFSDDSSWTIHFILKEIPLIIHNSEFSVAKGYRNFLIQFPDTNISIEGFFNYLFVEQRDGRYVLDIENHVEEEYRTNPKFESIKDIITKIRNNHPSANV